MSVQRLWQLKTPSSEHVRELTQALGISPLVATLLVNRDIKSPGEAEDYLAPRLKQLLDPAGIKGMPEAISRILSAIDANERITIYGDYDVDGMTSSAILTRFFKAVGYNPHCFLPNRFVDGYGLNADRIRELVSSGTRLFISVDCGITAEKQVALARELGADFIIVDHHQLPEGELPPANAILNPHQPDCSFPFKDLCAAGLAFYLAMGLRAEMRRQGRFADSPEPDLRELLDIAAIGTVTDVVPLKGLNRILVSTGLPHVAQSKHPGIRALVGISASGRPVKAGTIAFQIGPRLNAAGRLSHPMKGYELLSTDDPARAQEIAEDVEAENKERRHLQDNIEQEALAMAADLGPEQPAYVLWSEDWHAGVTGVVASRIVERFHRPCCMVALVDGVGKGSIRSITGFDAVQGLRECDDLLAQFGGHPHAAGVTVDPSNLQAFREAFASAARTMTPADCLKPRLGIDANVDFDQLNSALLEDIDRLEPFGAGNREPVLATHGVRVAEVRLVGADKRHLKMRLEHNGQRLDAIAFGRGGDAPSVGDLIDVAYRPEHNYWQGRVSLQLRIRDFQNQSQPVSA